MFVLIIDSGNAEETSEYDTLAEAQAAFGERAKRSAISSALIMEYDDDGNTTRIILPTHSR